jgi:hypothetical protein
VRASWCLVLVLLAGCRTAGTVTAFNGAAYTPTEPEDIEVLTEMPPGAVVIGEVEGHGTEGFLTGDDATRDAQELAASIGAHAIVVTGHGTALEPGDILQRRVSTLKATAIRRE